MEKLKSNHSKSRDFAFPVVGKNELVVSRDTPGYVNIFFGINSIMDQETALKAIAEEVHSLPPHEVVLAYDFRNGYKVKYQSWNCTPFLHKEIMFYENLTANVASSIMSTEGVEMDLSHTFYERVFWYCAELT
jgi:hypothetical protein